MNIERHKEKLSSAKRLFWNLTIGNVALVSLCFLTDSVFLFSISAVIVLIWLWSILRMILMRKVVSDVTSWKDSGLLDQLENHEDLANGRSNTTGKSTSLL